MPVLTGVPRIAASVGRQSFAVQLMILQAALFAAETMAIHHIGSRASVMQIAFIRGLAGMALAFLLARHMGLSLLRTQQLGLQLLRGGVSLLYMVVMIYSFSHLPFGDATAISFTQAAYIALFSVLILNEHVSPARWTAAAVGIAGAMLIAKPSFAGWNAAYAVALIGTSCNGLAFVLNRYLQQKDSQNTTMFYTNAVCVLGSLPFLSFAEFPAPETLYCLPALVFCGPIGMYAGIVAVKHASASSLGPYTLLRLVIGLAGGVLIFRELPDSLSALGSLLILGSCLLALHSGKLGQPIIRPREALSAAR